MANKEFLETYPLYKKFKTEIKFFPGITSGISAMDLPKPAVHMHCTFCGSEQTFNMTNEYWDDFKNMKELIYNHVKKLDYVCSSCKTGLRIFLIHFSTEKVGTQNRIVLEKVGQIPAWSIDMNKDLEDILDEHADYYKKGLISESQGYGIGAFAYFRRITEEIIDELLESIADLIPEVDRDAYSTALDETKKTRVAQEKIDLVKDLLPLSLRPDGINPLSALHSALSEGLHSENDEECLEYADAVKKSLIYLIDQVMRAKRSSKNFTESMRKILDKKANKNKEESKNQPDFQPSSPTL
jgi:flagellar motility protein MotE (MotC chaperone)